MSRIALLVLALCMFTFNVHAQEKQFKVEVEQLVVGSNLQVDIFVQRTGAEEFAFASTNFTFFMTTTYLNLPGTTKHAASDGPWDKQTMPFHYDDCSMGKGSNYLVFNINRSISASSEGYKVPTSRTRVGRLVIPILDHSGFNTLLWRTGPPAMLKWDGVDIKDKCEFVNPAPNFPLCYTPTVPQLASTGVSICPGATTTLTSNYAGINEWYKDGVLIPNVSGTQLEVSQAGNYTARSTFYSCKSDASSVVAVSITNLDPPVLTIQGSSTICSNGSTTISSTHNGAHKWYKDGQEISGQTTNALSVSSAGSYSAIAIENSCESSLASSVQINVAAEISPVLASVTGTVLCPGQNVTITSDYNGDHKWYFNNQLIQSTGSQIDVNQPGDYRAEAISNCNSQPASITIRLAEIPTPTVLGSANEICGGDIVQLQSDKTGLHNWYLNGQLISNATGTTLNATEVGIYSASTKDGNCESGLSQQFVISAKTISAPVLQASAATEICEGDQLLLSSDKSGEHQWFSNGQLQAETSSELIVNSEGIYTASVRDGNCTSSLSESITVQVIPNPEQPTITQAGNMLSTDASVGIQWYKDGIIIPDAISPTLLVTESGNYTVSSTNECAAATSEPFAYISTGIVDSQTGTTFGAYPNPFVGQTTIYCHLTGRSEVKLYVHNMIGQTVATLHEGYMDSGQHVFEFGSDVQAISSGTYTVTLVVDGKPYSTKIVELQR